MPINGYRVDAEEARRWAKKNGIKRVLIQSPPGLRKIAQMLVEKLSGDLEEVFVHGGGCWGGCDLAVSHAKAVQADGIIHLGHVRFLEKDPIPTLYLECRRTDPEPLLAALESGRELIQQHRKVGVGATVQWLDFLNQVESRLREYGAEVLIGAPTPPLRYKGQILGCAYEPLLRLSNKVDCYLIIGSRFHGLGLALQTEKPVYSLDPELKRVSSLDVEVERALRSRYGYIERFRRSGRVGILVSVKPGQYRMGVAVKLKRLLKDSGMKAEILIMDDVEADLLKDSGLEGFVNTACPRLSIEDQQRVDMPLLLPMEALVAVGAVRWEEVVRTPRYFSMEV